MLNSFRSSMVFFFSLFLFFFFFLVFFELWEKSWSFIRIRSTSVHLRRSFWRRHRTDAWLQVPRSKGTTNTSRFLLILPVTMQAYNFTNSSLETQCLLNLLPRNFEELLQPLCLLSMLCDTHRLLGVPGLSPRRPHVTLCFMDDRRWYLCRRPQISAPYCRRWTTSEPYSTLIFFCFLHLIRQIRK